MKTRRVLAVLLISITCEAAILAQPTQEWVTGTWVAIQTEDAAGSVVYAIRTDTHGTLEVVLDASWGPAQPYWSQTKSGSQVSLQGRIEGRRIVVMDPNDVLVLQSYEVEELILPNTLGVQRVLVIMARYSNTVIPPYLPEELEAVMREEVNPALVAFSFGQFALDLPTTTALWLMPWWRIPLDNGPCTTAHAFELADLADAAAKSEGYDVSSFQHLVYAMPVNNTCPWKGLGTIGGSPSRAWLNGFFALAPRVVVHEIGHNLGLFHSHSCRTLGPVVLTDSCTVEDLGDFLDSMGSPPIDPVTSKDATPPYNASQAERLGWIGEQGPPFREAPPITEVQSSGVYTLAPYAMDEATPTGESSRALKIQRTDQAGSQFYYVEARRAVGEDRFLSAFPDITTGVTLHTSNMGDGRSSVLLDAHPQTVTWNDAALALGETYTEPSADFSLYVMTAGPNGAEVAVNMPTDEISLSLLSPWVSTWRYGETLRIEAQLLVGTQPAHGALWEWAVDIPGWGFFLQPPETLEADGIWRFSYPLTPDLPTGLYTIYARATWWDKVAPTPCCYQGSFILAP